MINRIWAYAIVNTATDQAAFWRSVTGLGLTDVALFVNGLDEERFVISPARERVLADAIMGLHRNGVSPHLVSWLRPTERYMNDAALRLRALCMTWGVRSLQFDAEEPWTRHPTLRGKGATAARAFLDRHWAFDYWPCPLGVTGITFVPDAVMPLAERCHYVLPQAYSIASASTVYRPGQTQRIAHERWSRFGKPIVMGLAAWKLNRSGGLTQTASMQRAIVAAESLTVPVVNEVAYWSLRWILQSKERSAFVAGACAKARAGMPQSAPAPAPASPPPPVAHEWALEEF
jgi:hypothetical protein